MKCEICGKGISDGTSLYRQNEKGQPGVWRCRVHVTAPVDPIVEEVVEAIEDANNG